MANVFRNAISSIRNGFRSSYQPLNGSDRIQAVPGSFIIEEQNQDNGGRNSHKRINQWSQTITNIVSYIFIKPVILILLLMFRVLAKLLAVVFNKDPDTDEAIHDPLDKVNKFIRSLEDNLTPEQFSSENNLPPFYQGSYTQALYMATNRGKFLFVYLTNSNNESSQEIFQKIITNGEFISIFQDNPDILIWGGDLTNPEAYQLANSLNVTKFPFLGVLCLTRTTTMTPEGPVKTPPKISLITKIQGNVKSNESVIIQRKFKHKLMKYEHELKLIRTELQDKYMSQLLAKQQAANYQNSLNKDILKKKQKHQEQMFKQYLIYKLGIIRQWPQEDSPDNAKIAIKLLDGTRRTFYFPADQTVEYIYTYVELENRGYLHDPNLITTISEYEFNRRFDGFVPNFKFELVSPLPPRTSLNELKQSKIMDVPSIYPNGVLIIEEI